MTLDKQGKNIKVGDRVQIKMKSGFYRYGWVEKVLEDEVSVMADGNTNPYSVTYKNVTVINKPCLKR